MSYKRGNECESLPQAYLFLPSHSLAFGGRESVRSQMPPSLQEYHGRKNNIEHITLFSVHYICTIPVFRGW